MKLIDFLEETGNTTRPINWDTSNPHGMVGDFVYNDLQYRIMIETNYEPTLLKIFEGKKQAFVSFLYFDPITKKYTQDITGLAGPAAGSIFSIVKNAIKPIFINDFDIVYFAAKRDRSPTAYDTRVRLYDHLYSRLIHETGCPGYVVPGTNSVTYVVSKEPIDKEIEYIKTSYDF
jgi:hypothetical protein